MIKNNICTETGRFQSYSEFKNSPTIKYCKKSLHQFYEIFDDKHRGDFRQLVSDQMKQKVIESLQV